MDLRTFMKDNFVILDGGLGTMLYSKGMKSGECTEQWNISHPDAVTEIHRAYYDAGSNVVSTNTFGVNTIKYTPEEADRMIDAAVANVRAAMESSSSSQEKFVALDIGPTGKLLKPIGELEFEDAVNVFKFNVAAGLRNNVDLFFIETFNDCYETKAALLAVRELTDKPVFVSNAYGENGKLMSGTTPSCMCAMIEGMGADAIGANCSFGPAKLRNVISELLLVSSIPVLFKPNAGLPVITDKGTAYDISPAEFTEEIAQSITDGVRIAGGCCGTTPEYISALAETAGNTVLKPVRKKNLTCISSCTDCVVFDGIPVIIGERINPTGKKKLREAIFEKNNEFILEEAISQCDSGACVLDVNVGVPGIDEPTVLTDTVALLQNTVSVPLQIDSSNPDALEKALRIYNGKAMINSVNGKEESMNTVFPIAKKYGGLIVALTLDENGIPDTVQGRVDIAKKIISRAGQYGIDKKDLIFDTLAMTVSADKNAALITVESLKRIKDELGCRTSLGVSNVSFGMPDRQLLNSSFFLIALENGLDAAIVNPLSAQMMNSYYSYLALHGLDDNFSRYIAYCEKAVKQEIPSQKNDMEITLQKAIEKGLTEAAHNETEKLLKTKDPLSVVENIIIPALDSVGLNYESGRIYLPQLLTSAEAAKQAFEVIKSRMSAVSSDSNVSIILATVKGDIHDIGKNIVKLLLENYGFNVIDLGKDVPPEEIVREAEKTGTKFIGLSALMTTTVPAMEETIKLIREKIPDRLVVVGGAVLTEEYAKKIGADKYAPDAMATVKFVQENSK